MIEGWSLRRRGCEASGKPGYPRRHRHADQGIERWWIDRTSHSWLLDGSRARLLGGPLTDRDAARLYEDAPRPGAGARDRRRSALGLREPGGAVLLRLRPDEILTLPSRLSAEEADLESRRRVFEQVERAGYVTGYCGIRVAKSGRRFRIENATIWRLIDEDGVLRGEAAMVARWRDV